MIWKTSDDTVIEFIHPIEAKIDKNVNGTIIRASLFKTKTRDKGTASVVDNKKMMEQNNYTNMFLKTLGDQLNTVEEVIETQEHIKTSFVNKNTKPLFKPFEFSKIFQENSFVNQDLIEKISQKVKYNLIIPETPQPSLRRINAINEEISFKVETDELIKIFKETFYILFL